MQLSCFRCSVQYCVLQQQGGVGGLVNEYSENTHIQHNKTQLFHFKITMLTLVTDFIIALLVLADSFHKRKNAEKV